MSHKLPSCPQMASKFLQRLRSTPLKEERGPGPPEEPPESAELVDDTEGLSLRLSGTLSLSEDSLASQESDGMGTSYLGSDGHGDSKAQDENNSHTFLTNQLREMWQHSRDAHIPIRLTFEVTDANIVQDAHAKYVVYTIYLLQTGQYDASPAYISCRYSDLFHLKRRLLELYPSEMRGVSFPRKRVRKNFTPETIAKRSRAFEQFLCHVSSLPALRTSSPFLNFFYLRDIQKAQALTCAGLYKLAIPIWTNSYHLQEKLCPPGPSTNRLLVLAGLVVCHQESDTLEEAQAFSERAVALIQDAQDKHISLLVPFLNAHIQLSWRVGIDKRESEALLQRLQEAGHYADNVPSLKEFLVKETIS
ncbi:sorting nexin-21 isoform X2 [Xenopus laevis]|uniref:Sorting nexin-21 isoform X2 n=1 Tax=Xenopus laevis TaxID=8355 RepID=A0A8J0TTM9_XENLA|nr:sorting nexin-21 isoform X2 [Xenopus laevis]